ncbi:MAG: hypothetical protein AB1752_13590 [Candidatus Zixiibacteriota bacterium]
MRCYIWGTNNREERDTVADGIVSFAIPDLGIQFRSRHPGTASECEYVALLGLINFANNNHKLFEQHQLEVYTDAVALVYQLNRKAIVPPALERHARVVQTYRDKHRFSIGWVPKDENRAFTGVLDLAPLKTKTRIELGSADPTNGQFSSSNPPLRS